jgi:hypothetical protein
MTTDPSWRTSAAAVPPVILRDYPLLIREYPWFRWRTQHRSNASLRDTPAFVR